MAKIKNFKQLAVTPLRKKALLIAEAGFQAIDTPQVIKQNVRLEGQKLRIRERSFDLRKHNRIFVVGVGKCSLEAASALEQILGKLITAGIVVDVHPGKLKQIKVYAGSHPMPTEKNVDITRQIVRLLKRTAKNDLVIFVVSGGGSSLLCQPGNFTCRQEILLEQALLRAGATINEVNTVRKHLSLARGGFLAKYAYPSRVISLLISDVPGDNVQFIASGPTVRDRTTIRDAQKVLRRLDVPKACAALKHELIETPKDSKYFKNVRNILLVTNRLALAAMAREARKFSGFTVREVSARLRGEARGVAKQIVLDLAKAKPRTVLLYGGETTVVVKGRGTGGRNQELALAALPAIKRGQLLLPLASDGRDNTDAAGAVCDIITKDKAQGLGLNIKEYLKQSDSYAFFRKAKAQVLTGDTGSNVSDLIIALKN